MWVDIWKNTKRSSWKNAACYVAVSHYLTQVLHGHPGCGNVKVWSLAPFAFHIFIVIFLIFELCEKEIISVMPCMTHINLFCLTKHAGNDRNLCNFSPLLVSPLTLDAGDDIREQVDSYSEPLLKVRWPLMSPFPHGCTVQCLEFGSFVLRNVGPIYLLVWHYNNECTTRKNQILLNLKSKLNKLNHGFSCLLLKSPPKTSFCQIIIKAETTSCQLIFEIKNKTELWQIWVTISYITALLVHCPSQHHFRRIRQRGVLSLALIMALLVLDLWGHRQQDVGDSKTLLAPFVCLHWLVPLQHQQKE